MAISHGTGGRPAHVLLAPDKFKGSLDAATVAARLAAGLRRAAPDVPLVELPVADGGDGTVDAAVTAGFTRVHAATVGPTGEPIAASFALRQEGHAGGTAVVEIAAGCGLRLLPGGRPAPLTASSRGAGLLARAALATGCRRLVLGLGGSACTDGGAGLLRGLGARLYDADGREVPDGGTSLVSIRRIELAPVRRLLDGVELVVASDVTAPLLGADGAAAVFGPQKGASPADVTLLDAGLAHWADLLDRATGTEHRDTPAAGAAGGIGFAALALGARAVSGIDLVLNLLSFERRLAGARLVVTGEGALDAQSLRGKAPAGVAAAAGRHGVPVVAVAGRCTLSREQLADAGFAGVFPLTDLEPDLRTCVDEAGPLLERVGAWLALDLLTPRPATIADAVTTAADGLEARR